VLLLAAAVLMAVTGAGFAVITDFWPLLVIAFVGTMNPTSGDASIFVPLEQTVLTQTIAARSRTALFARSSVIGSCATALGVLAAALPDFTTGWTSCTRAAAMQLMFGLYAGLGLVALLLYRPLSMAVRPSARRRSTLGGSARPCWEASCRTPPMPNGTIRFLD
jgi:MFS family permease